MAETTVQVTALKPFALGRDEHQPGPVKVPAKSVARLVEKGFIEAPEQPVEEEAGKPLATQAEVEETVASYLSGTFGIKRSSEESAAEFVSAVMDGPQRRIRQLSTELAQANQEVEDAKGQLATSKSQLAEAKAATTKAKADLTNMARDRDGLKSELDKVKAELETLKKAQPAS